MKEQEGQNFPGLGLVCTMMITLTIGVVAVRLYMQDIPEVVVLLAIVTCSFASAISFVSWLRGRDKHRPIKPRRGLMIDPARVAITIVLVATAVIAWWLHSHPV